MAAPSSGIVISLDVELHWGVRDHVRPGHSYWRNLEGDREATRRLLELFAERNIHATWAVVGMLFARDRVELAEHRPKAIPQYADPRLSPYAEEVGEGEHDDPLHYGASLVGSIAKTAGQEVGSHTYSHYYAQEAGQSAADIAADLDSAQRIAERHGLKLRSIVFPRNQARPDYLDVVRDAGFVAFRGPERGWMYDTDPRRRKRADRRVARALDAYIGLRGSAVEPWSMATPVEGLVDVRGTHFLRAPRSPRDPLARLQRKRLAVAMQEAAKRGGFLHLWWHPHNFGHAPEMCCDHLASILEDFEELRRSHGMMSLTMLEAAERRHG